MKQNLYILLLFFPLSLQAQVKGNAPVSNGPILKPNYTAPIGGGGSNLLPDPLPIPNDVIPHSPEAEAIVKHVTIPVNYFSGQTQISVPIFEIKASGFSLPLSMAYNNNGFKPFEKSTWVGLGWNIQGIGSIVRTIKGQLDENATLSGNRYDDFVNVNISPLTSSQPFMKQILIGSADVEPDVYIFNIGEYSGKFILIKDEAYLFPHQNIKILPYGEGFKMIDDKGNIYILNASENTFTKGNIPPNHTSAWFVSQITTADKKDEIYFNYATYSFKQANNYVDNYSILFSPGVNNQPKLTHLRLDGDHINAVRISSITSKYANISFIASTQPRLDETTCPILEKIVITDPNNLFFKREINLNHDYFPNNSKLKLTGCYTRKFGDLSSGQNNYLDGDKYSFEYIEDGSMFSDISPYAVDNWGYYNGKNNNTTFFATGTIDNESVYAYADRGVHSEYSSLGMLKKITYPTGGYSTFSYEQNQSGTSYLTSDYTIGGFLDNVKFDPKHQEGGKTINIRNFSINKRQMVTLHFINYDDFHNPTVPILKIYKGSTDPDAVPIYSSPILNVGYYKNIDSTILDAGDDYYAVVTCESTIVGSDVDYGTAGGVGFKNYKTFSNLKDGPGLRVSTISFFDKPAINTPALIKKYAYTNGIDNFQSGIVSSDYLFECSGYTSNSNQISVKTPGSNLSDIPFYYRNVSETSQDIYKTGRISYEFATFNATGDIKLTSQTTYKTINKILLPIKKEISNYERIPRIGFTAFQVKNTSEIGPVIPPSLGCPQLSSPDPTQAAYVHTIAEPYNNYVLGSDYVLLKQTREISYADNGKDNSINQIDYYYENPDHLSPTKIIETNTAGDVITQELKYPFDYNFNSCVTPNTIFNNFKAGLQAADLAINNKYNNLISLLRPYSPYANNTAANQQAFTNITNQYHIINDYKSAISQLISDRNTSLTTFNDCINNTINTNNIGWQKAVAWMQLNNITSPVIEKFVSIKKSGDINEYLLSGTRHEYGVVNAQGVAPISVKHTEINSRLLKSDFLSNKEFYYKPEIIYTYDQDLNLVSQQKVNNLTTTYLYGYNQVYPLAEIKNATFANVLTSLGLSEGQYQIESKSSIPSSSYLSKINALRQTMSGAMVKTFTYTPLIGLISKTDENNITTYFEYDGFQRLKNVKDQDGKIIKNYNYHYQGQPATK